MKLTIYTDEKTQQEALGKIKSVMPDAYIIFDTGDKPKTADEMFRELGYVKEYSAFYDWGETMYKNKSGNRIYLGDEFEKTKALIPQGFTCDEIKAIAKYIEEQEQ